MCARVSVKMAGGTRKAKRGHRVTTAFRRGRSKDQDLHSRHDCPERALQAHGIHADGFPPVTQHEGNLRHSMQTRVLVLLGRTMLEKKATGVLVLRMQWE